MFAQLSVLKKVYAMCSCLFFTVFRECEFFFSQRYGPYCQIPLYRHLSVAEVSHQIV